MIPRYPLLAGAICLALGSTTLAQVPTDVEQPGTQPLEVTNIEHPNLCDICHGGFDPAVEPSHGWRGSMMSHAGRDPIFWATVAVAEQDFEGAGNFCLRCHAPRGWLNGRAARPDGSLLAPDDDTGVSCDLCHSLVDPDGSEHPGVQNAPYLANDEGTPPVGYHGSGMFVLSPFTEKLGPYDDAQPVSHTAQQSLYHRSSELCGTCHDVSNPVVGDLAHNNGSMVPLAPGTFSGVPGSPVDGKAAFNHFPFEYGTVERTTSEHAISALSSMRVSSYGSLPPELQDGSIQEAWEAAMASTATGDYVDGAPRYFSCQSCHMSPATGKAAWQGTVATRTDLALHDLTGGNHWIPSAMLFLDDLGELVLGGSLSSNEQDGMVAGAQRAVHNLEKAGALEVAGDTLKVINLTGHKLITGFPEGRRMWLNVKWMDAAGNLVREDGAYGPIPVVHEGNALLVESLIDLADPNLRLYEIMPGMTQEWASQLLALGWTPDLALTYDRFTGAVGQTLGDLAAQPPGTELGTFHFVLNNTTAHDTRIPPYGMPYDAALERSILPVPDDQYGDPGPGGIYRHWDEVALNPPAGAVTADIRLLYQSTSWEYIQFLDLANDRSVTHLASTGNSIFKAWLATDMAAPVEMARTTWTIGGFASSYCFCESGPCQNDDERAGCANSTGIGALLTVGGTPSESADDLAFAAEDLPPRSPALLFVADNAVNGGLGTAYGDGLRCADGGVVRLGVATADLLGMASWGPDLGTKGGWSSGDLRRFQVWYRDPFGGPCGNLFNLTQGIEVTFLP